MARLTQEEMSVGDDNELTISLWYKVVDPELTYEGAPETPIPLIEWGDFTDDTMGMGSGLYWLPCPSYGGRGISGLGEPFYPALVFQVVAPTGSEAAGLGGDYLNNPALTNYRYLAGSGTPYFWAQWPGGEALEPPNFLIGQWQHVMIAINTNGVSLGDVPNSGPTLIPFINGFDYGFLSGDTAPAFWLPTAAAYEAEFGPFTEDPGGSMEYAAFTNNLHIPFQAEGDGGPEPAFGPAQFDVPAFNIAFDGKKIALPGFHNPNKQVHLAHVQMWVGQFIDPRDHLDKFLNVSGLHGTPVAPSVASAAFGPPTFLFKGGKSSFLTNQGTGGAFVATGTTIDQSNPSY